MLAIIRRVVACLVFLMFAASFVPWGGEASALWWVERVQFVPALLGAWSGRAWAAVVLAVLVVLTLLFGRVFCSWLCPLGILQDAAYRVAHLRQRRSVRYAPNHPRLRACMAVLAFGGLVGGQVGLLTWADPYSIAARGMAAFVNPLLTWVADAAGAELTPPAWERYAPWGMAVAAFSLAVPLVMAVWRGRLYCNTLCPVGAVLGLLSRRALCTPHIDEGACARCGACMKHCKAQAIDVRHMRVDTTRCVACYDCLSACNNGAVRLRPRARKTEAVPAAPAVDSSRRAFLGMSVAGLATAALPEPPEPTPGTDAASPCHNESPAAVPPGAQSVERLLSHCSACGLCIAACPTQVLRPSLLALGLRGFMKPTLNFSRAACAADCTVCSHACPTGALLPLSLAEKRRTQIGLVHFTQSACRVWQEGVACGKCVTEVRCPTGALEAQEVNIPTVNAELCRGCRRCARVCPAGAISMVEVAGRGKRLAAIDRSKCIGCGACAAACRPQVISLQPRTAPRLAHAEKCIGCGACEHVCPATPQKALRVVPRAVHLQTPGET